MKKLPLLLLSFFLFPLAYSQKPHQPSAAEIFLKLKKLNFLGSVLYMAAHPDDENTRLIAYMANEELANTAYLSMTRGDGGQNLIGPEIREALGVIRTQELLAARRIDGGKQFFTRANDFGYSKSTEETQKIWDRKKALADVVWVFRSFKPDVVITRFPPDERAGHGHHTTSAIFAEEAFDLSADEKQYPEQLKYVDAWQPKRLYTNTGRWWNPNMTGDEKGVLTVDVGEYNEPLGTSYTEMAALSRSQHKSQGFGSSGSRGESLEFLEYVKGDEAESDIFDGIETSWKRVKGGKAVGDKIAAIIAKYNPADPSASLQSLLETRDMIKRLEDEHWKRLKLNEIEELIRNVTGLYLGAYADGFAAVPGNRINLSLELVNRSQASVKLSKISYLDHDSVANAPLPYNEGLVISSTVFLPESMPYSQHYWLKEKGTLGMYHVKDQKLIGKPENDPALQVKVNINIEGYDFEFKLPVVFRWNDPVAGEKYRPLVIAPPAFVNIAEQVYIFPEKQEKSVRVVLKAMRAGLSGKVMLDAPAGWKVEPGQYTFSTSAKGDEEMFKFNITPPDEQSVGKLLAKVQVDGKYYNKSLATIDYGHIVTQVMMPEAEARAVKIDIKKQGDVVGYIHGAGDAIPSSLREIGYDVVELTEADVRPAVLKNLDAVILGVRVLNTNPRIGYFMDNLLEYVKEGGTLIVQYNTSHRLKTDHFAPYPLELSRDRVTDELAPVEIINPDHPVLNYPNKITAKDFEGWVQERGLYFPDSWSGEYTAVLSSHDKGESPKDGGLLIAPYGKGYYIYTGYSWFRELPAGVPGAYRLFVNMVSLGNDEEAAKVSKAQSK